MCLRRTSKQAAVAKMRLPCPARNFWILCGATVKFSFAACASSAGARYVGKHVYVTDGAAPPQ